VSKSCTKKLILSNTNTFTNQIVPHMGSKSALKYTNLDQV